MEYPIFFHRFGKQSENETKVVWSNMYLKYAISEIFRIFVDLSITEKLRLEWTASNKILGMDIKII